MTLYSTVMMQPHRSHATALSHSLTVSSCALDPSPSSRTALRRMRSLKRPLFSAPPSLHPPRCGHACSFATFSWGLTPRYQRALPPVDEIAGLPPAAVDGYLSRPSWAPTREERHFLSLRESQTAPKDLFILDLLCATTLEKLRSNVEELPRGRRSRAVAPFGVAQSGVTPAISAFLDASTSAFLVLFSAGVPGVTRALADADGPLLAPGLRDAISRNIVSPAQHTVTVKAARIVDGHFAYEDVTSTRGDAHAPEGVAINGRTFVASGHVPARSLSRFVSDYFHYFGLRTAQRAAGAVTVAYACEETRVDGAGVRVTEDAVHTVTWEAEIGPALRDAAAHGAWVQVPLLVKLLAGVLRGEPPLATTRAWAAIDVDGHLCGGNAAPPFSVPLLVHAATSTRARMANSLSVAAARSHFHDAAHGARAPALRALSNALENLRAAVGGGAGAYEVAVARAADCAAAAIAASRTAARTDGLPWISRADAEFDAETAWDEAKETRAGIAAPKRTKSSLFFHPVEDSGTADKGRARAVVDEGYSTWLREGGDFPPSAMRSLSGLYWETRPRLWMEGGELMLAHQDGVILAYLSVFAGAQAVREVAATLPARGDVAKVVAQVDAAVDDFTKNLRENEMAFVIREIIRAEAPPRNVRAAWSDAALRVAEGIARVSELLVAGRAV